MRINQAYDDDLIKSSQPRIYRREIAAGLIFAATAYAVSLITTLPAALVFQLPSNVSTTGTLWHGKATLPGDNEASWTVDPFRSLLHFSFAVDWELTGPDAQLAGRARYGLSAITVDDGSGRVGAGFVKAFIPAASMLCDGEARVDIRHFRWSRADFEAEGELRSAPASCPSPQGAAEVVPLIASFTGENGLLSARLAAADRPATVLAIATLNPAGRLTAELRPEAEFVLPGLPQTMPNAGPFRIETTIEMP